MTRFLKLQPDMHDSIRNNSVEYRGAPLPVKDHADLNSGLTRSVHGKLRPYSRLTRISFFALFKNIQKTFELVRPEFKNTSLHHSLIQHYDYPTLSCLHNRYGDVFFLTLRAGWPFLQSHSFIVCLSARHSFIQ